jgi:hypothetical protein
MLSVYFEKTCGLAKSNWPESNEMAGIALLTGVVASCAPWPAGRRLRDAPC